MLIHKCVLHRVNAKHSLQRLVLFHCVVYRYDRLVVRTRLIRLTVGFISLHNRVTYSLKKHSLFCKLVSLIDKTNDLYVAVCYL